MYSYDFTNLSQKECIIMVGLPARGKSYTAKKLTNYFNWVGCKSKIFNVGDYRRKYCTTHECRSTFFDFKNTEAVKARESYADEALQDMVRWLSNQDSKVAIYDATNIKVARRKKISTFLANKNFSICFIESICDKKEIIEYTINKIKVCSADYIEAQRQEAFIDFSERLRYYEEAYEPLGPDEELNFPYIKTIDAGCFIQMGNLQGLIQLKTAFLLMNMHIKNRVIYITRHGESEYNLEDRIGGDAALTKNGELYASRLSEFMKEEKIDDLTVWTSRLKRSSDTAKHFDCKKSAYKALNEINAGICENMTYTEIKERYPDIHQNRAKNKYEFQYPSGESYKDVFDRIEPLIFEIEKNTNLLIISHYCVSRCILAYLMGVSHKMTPYIKIPLNTVFKLTQNSNEWKIQKYEISLDPNPNTLYTLSDSTSIDYIQM